SRPFRSTAARAGTSTARKSSGHRPNSLGDAPCRKTAGTLQEWYICRFMLSLNLAKIRDAKERFEQVYSPGQLATGDEAFRVAAPVTLAFDIYKDKDQFRLIGSVQTTLELPCSRCLEPFTLPVDSSFD